MWMGEDSGCQNASCIYSKENTDIYYQDINYNCLYYCTILTTNNATNKVSYFTIGHNANKTHNMCVTGVCKVCKSKPN